MSVASIYIFLKLPKVNVTSSTCKVRALPSNCLPTRLRLSREHILTAQICVLRCSTAAEAAQMAAAMVAAAAAAVMRPAAAVRAADAFRFAHHLYVPAPPPVARPSVRL